MSGFNCYSVKLSALHSAAKQRGMQKYWNVSFKIFNVDEEYFFHTFNNKADKIFLSGSLACQVTIKLEISWQKTNMAENKLGET